LELIGGLRFCLVNERDVGQNRACRGKNQWARERIEDFKPVFPFRAGRTITAMRAAAGVLGDCSGTFFTFGESHNESIISMTDAKKWNLL
jgi:hypothetical protein